MQAVVLRKANDLAVLDVPIPDIGPDQALVRVTHSGICGSDIRYLRGDNPWAKQTLGEKRANPANIILGHEIAGVVESVGDECDPTLQGTRVAVLAFGTCGECAHCSRGEEHLCASTKHLGHGAGWAESSYYYGGMAELVPVPAKWLVSLPERVSNEAGAALDPLGVAVHGVRRTGLRGGDTVLIVGGGAVGALAAQVSRVFGAAGVVVVDVCDAVLDVAYRMGADLAINPLREDPASAVADLSVGRGAAAILDTVGAPLSTYLPLLARGGRYVTMTVTDDPQEVATATLAGERSLTSSCNFHYSDYWEALSMLENGTVDPDPIFTHRFSLAEAIEAFRVAEDKQATGAVKVLLISD